MLSMVEGTKVSVPALYCRSRLSVCNTYQLYAMRSSEKGAFTSYSRGPESKVVVCAGAPELVHCQGLVLRLLLTTRYESYAAYVGDNRYRLRRLTRHVKIRRVHFRGMERVRPVSADSRTVVESPGGYVLYNSYIEVYSGMRGVGTVSFTCHKASTRMVPTFGGGVTRASYMNYKRYHIIYPANTVDVRAGVSRI